MIFFLAFMFLSAIIYLSGKDEKHKIACEMKNENKEVPGYALIAEFITIFAVVPALLAFRTVEIPLMPIITVAYITR
ncbi:MAG: hypothetical protein A2020_11520 [Lentisphaerae bacterium GWF2_45_14]|nr:MAG: hypothetical protein A2020_11520 [Lentisphaerae bacterium GWF2_45_14]